MLHITMGDSRLTVAFGVANNLAVPVFLYSSFTESLLKSLYPSWRIVGLNNTMKVPKIAIRDLPEEYGNKDEKVKTQRR